MRAASITILIVFATMVAVVGFDLMPWNFKTAFAAGFSAGFVAVLTLLIRQVVGAFSRRNVQ